MKKSIAAAVTAAFLTFGAAGVASAAQASDGWGGARVKAAKTIYDTNGLRRTPRMLHGAPVLVPDARTFRGQPDREAADFVAVPEVRRRIT